MFRTRRCQEIIALIASAIFGILVLYFAVKNAIEFGLTFVKFLLPVCLIVYFTPKVASYYDNFLSELWEDLIKFIHWEYIPAPRALRLAAVTLVFIVLASKATAYISIVVFLFILTAYFLNSSVLKNLFEYYVFRCARVPVSNRALYLYTEDYYKEKAIEMFNAVKVEYKGKICDESNNGDGLQLKRAKRLFNEVKMMFISKKARLTLFSNVSFDKFNWEIIVIKSDEINACTVGWGMCFVYTKLLEKFDDDTVKSVFAHEIAHMVARHVDESVATVDGSSSAIWWFKTHLNKYLTKKIELTEEYVRNISKVLVLLSAPFSQFKEIEADAIGMELLKLHNDDASIGMVQFCETILDSEGRMNDSSFMSTHPSHKSRMRACACRKFGLSHEKTLDVLQKKSSGFRGFLALDRWYLGHNFVGLCKTFSCFTVILGWIWIITDQKLWKELGSKSEGLGYLQSEFLPTLNNDNLFQLKFAKNEEEIEECVLRCKSLQSLNQELRELRPDSSNYETINDRDLLIKEIIQLKFPNLSNENSKLQLNAPLSKWHKFLAIFPYTGLFGLDRLCGPKGSLMMVIFKLTSTPFMYIRDIICILFFPPEDYEVDDMLCLAVHPFTGILGLDRFYRGHYVYGLLKLFTMGGFLIWYVYDAYVAISS
jgi:Zn-dependent protease with chaperone function